MRKRLKGKLLEQLLKCLYQKQANPDYDPVLSPDWQKNLMQAVKNHQREKNLRRVANDSFTEQFFLKVACFVFGLATLSVFGMIFIRSLYPDYDDRYAEHRILVEDQYCEIILFSAGGKK